MKPRALDLFCGAGGASMGLFRAGFDVVGVDIEHQPHYPGRTKHGRMYFVQDDAMTYPLDGYDLIWASPPCQAYTMAQRIQGNDHPALIDALRERLIANGKLYCIENVIGAPLRKPIELCGAMFGLKTYRHRRFECSFPVEQPWHQAHELIATQTKMGRKPKEDEFIQVVGNFSDVKAAREAMGINWMPRNKLSEAIPPAYSQYIGKAAILTLKKSK